MTRRAMFRRWQEMLSMKFRPSRSSLKLSQSTSYGIGAPQISSISFTRPGRTSSCNSLILRLSARPMLSPPVCLGVYWRIPRSGLPLRHRDHDIAIHHPAGMVALEIKRSRLSLVGIQRTASDAGNLLLVDRRDAVADDGHIAADERDVERLPLARLARQLELGGEEPVDRPHAVKRIFRARLLVLHLDFVAPAQVDSAVTFLGAVELDVKLEIVELPRGAEIRSVCFVQQHSILGDPVIDLGFVGLPAGQVFAVEQRLRAVQAFGALRFKAGARDPAICAIASPRFCVPVSW